MDYGKTNLEIGVMKDLLENNRLLFEVGFDNLSQPPPQLVAIGCSISEPHLVGSTLIFYLDMFPMTFYCG